MSFFAYRKAFVFPLAFGAAACAQILGLGEFKEENGSGGQAPTTGSSSTESTGALGTSSASTGGAGGMAPIPGTVLWAKDIGDSSDQEASRVAVSPDGHIYVVVRGIGMPGTTSGATLVALDPQGMELWTSNEPFGDVYGVAADDTGVVVAGMNYQTVNFSTGPELGFYFAKVNPTGQVQWVTACGGYSAEPPFDNAGDLVIDAMGRTTFVGTVGDVACGAPLLTGIIGLRALSDGTVSREFNVDNTAYTPIAGVAGNAAGGVAVGIPQGTVNVGAGNQTAPLVAKYDPYSTNSLTLKFVELLPKATIRLAFDKTGELFAAGEFTGAVTFGTTPLTAVGKDIFVTSVDSSGAPISAVNLGGQGDQSLASLALDKSHNLLLGGGYVGEAHFGADSVADGAFYVAKVGPGMSSVWVDSFGSPTLDTLQRLAVDGSNRVVIVGGFKSTTLTFGSHVLANSGGSDAFVAVIQP